MTLGDLVLKVRSKNAGPFWATIDIFCDRPEVFERLVASLKTEDVARLYQVPAGRVEAFRHPRPARHQVQPAPPDHPGLGR